MKRETALRAFMFLLFCFVLFLFFYYDAPRFLTLENLKDNYSDFMDFYDEHPVPTVLIFGAVYIAWTAFSFPAAFILAVATGAFFGLWLGTMIAVLATTLGSVLGFLSSRYVFKEWVERKLSPRMRKVKESLERNETYYLLFIRLLGVLPYFLVNIVAGVTVISTMSFFFITLVGIIPETFIFVNAGTHLTKLASLQDVTSPGFLLTLLPLALLALLPLAFRRFVRRHPSVMQSE